MAEQTHLSPSVEIKAESGQPGHDVNLFKPEVQVLFLTWVTFFILLVILYKFAWKPILQALDAREEGIRRAVDEAEKIRTEFEKIDEARKKVLTEAQDKAKELIDESRKAAVNAAKVIEQKTKEQAEIVLANAQREIKSEQEKAVALLREESARIAVVLAGKIIEENLDSDRNEKLVNRLIKEI